MKPLNYIYLFFWFFFPGRTIEFYITTRTLRSYTTRRLTTRWIYIRVFVFRKRYGRSFRPFPAGSATGSQCRHYDQFESRGVRMRTKRIRFTFWQYKRAVECRFLVRYLCRIGIKPTARRHRERRRRTTLRCNNNITDYIIHTIYVCMIIRTHAHT